MNRDMIRFTKSSYRQKEGIFMFPSLYAMTTIK